MAVTGTVHIPVVLDAHGDRSRVEVRFDPEIATGKDLADALARRLERPDAPSVPVTSDGDETGTGVWIDGVAIEPDTPLTAAGLVRGARLTITPPPGRTRPPRTDLELLVTAGVCAGTRTPLRPGGHVIGREGDIPLRSRTVSRRHARLEIDGTNARIADLGAHNGVLVNGVPVAEHALEAGTRCTLGAVELTVGVPPTPRPVTATDAGRGTMLLHRPPRRRREPSARTVRVPSAPRTTRDAPPFGWAAVLAPLALGAVMAVIFDPRYAAFMAFSPLIAVGTWYEQRRRTKRDERTASANVAAALEAFADELEVARAQALEHRRERYPHLPEILRRSLAGTAELWERRPHHPDFLDLVVGSGRVFWTPPLDGAGGGEQDDPTRQGVADVLEGATHLDEAPVTVDLRRGRRLGVSGERDVRLALARALLCQAAVLHGPADLRILVVHDAGRESDWAWTSWLPHGARGRGVVTLDPVALRDRSAEDGADLVRAALGPARGDTEPTVLVVLDVADVSAPVWAPVRELIGQDVAVLALADMTERLPSSATTVVDLHGADGAGRLERLDGAACDDDATRTVDDLLVVGLDTDNAAQVARRLARFEDPERTSATTPPGTVNLLDLLELAPRKQDVRARWSAHSTAGSLAAPIGRTSEDRAVIDLVRDGPHGLIGGTTGSGKSELLRSLVVGLAATYDASRVNFVLIDYKGGSAFDACADLPHTTGFVTDLDEHLAARALRCLEAELRRRERELRTVGANDIVAYARDRGDGAPPLPRLLVVVDEFAALASELPDFVDALVDVAQRGRSLGVHLLLATQRPSGAISDNIRANTNLRIALRMQDAADSTDVLGCADAAAIPDDRPGRALARRGTSGLVTFQTALCTQPARAGDGPVAEIVDAEEDRRTAGRESHEESDLSVLVTAIREAHEHAGVSSPREPWPPPLPERVDLDEVAVCPSSETDHDSALHGAVLGIVDEPEAQRQRPYVWDPVHSLLLFGIPGSGTTTALGTAAVALARRFAPDALHLCVLDFGSQELTELAALPHTGAVVGAHERERQERLVRFLGEELARRRSARHGVASAGSQDPRIVVLLDNYPGFASAFDGVHDIAVRDALHRVVADGPDVGITVVASADRLTGVPSSLSSVVAHKLLFRLPDRFDYTGLGVPPDAIPPPLPGRAVDVATGCEVHIALPGPHNLRAAVAAVAADHDLGALEPARRPRTVGVLPEHVKMAELAPHAHLRGRVWSVPVGLSGADLTPLALELGAAEPVLVAGPARSGKSGVLASITQLITSRGSAIELTAVTTRPSPLQELPGVSCVVASTDELRVRLEDVDGAHLVLVDDAHLVDDSCGILNEIASGLREDVRLVAAGRTDALRAAYGHWTGEVRRSRRGVVLQPNPAADGDLWQVTLPRRGADRFVPGRGYLVADGRAELVQCAAPDGVGAE